MSDGGATLTTTSAAQTSPIWAPAPLYASSGMSAPRPAPVSTTTSRPLPISDGTIFGTSATRRSPSFVSRTTPTVGRVLVPLCVSTDSVITMFRLPTLVVVRPDMEREEVWTCLDDGSTRWPRVCFVVACNKSSNRLNIWLKPIHWG